MINCTINSNISPCEIVLPIVMPISSTYMVPAAEFALLQSTRNGQNYINNRYIQTYSFGDILNKKTFDVGFSILTDPFEQNPCFVVTKIESNHDFLLNEQKMSIIECLRNGVYFYSYRYLDEYCISESRYYKKCCMLHMFLIYGCNTKDECFYTIGYDRRGIFSKIKIRFEEFDESIELLDRKEHRYSMLISHNDKYHEKDCDHVLIRNLIDQYINSKNTRIIQRGVNNEVAISDNLIFGYRTYDYLETYLKYFINNDAQIDDYDFRFSRQLFEHKKIMMNRLCVLMENGIIDDYIIKQYKFIVNTASILHNLNIKLLLTQDQNIFNNILNKLLVIKEYEKCILEKVIANL